MVQAAYWADTWAKAQGNRSRRSSTTRRRGRQARRLPAVLDVRQVLQADQRELQPAARSPARPAPARPTRHLPAVLVLRLGRRDRTGAWSWRISGSAVARGLPEPAGGVRAVHRPGLDARRPRPRRRDWAHQPRSRQLNMFYSGCSPPRAASPAASTNSWGGNYGDAGKPAGDADVLRHVLRPGSRSTTTRRRNQWFGFQAWSMERVAEYYYVTGNAEAPRSILDKWVTWAESVTTVNTSAGGDLPARHARPGAASPATSWTTGTSNSSAGGQHRAARQRRPDAPSRPRRGHLTGQDVYAYYAAKSGDTTAETDAQNILDVIHKNFADPLGYSAPETRTDYKRLHRRPTTPPTSKGVFIPSNWTGKYPGGIPLSSVRPTRSCRSGPGTSATRSGPRSRPT